MMAAHEYGSRAAVAACGTGAPQKRIGACAAARAHDAWRCAFSTTARWKSSCRSAPGRNEVQDFVARHQDWILRQRRRASILAHEFPPDRLELKAIGETWHCQAVQAPAAAASAVLADATAGGRLLRELAPSSGGGVLNSPRALMATPCGLPCSHGWARAARAAFARGWPRWLRASAVACRRLQIRSQRTRWGSCSTSRHHQPEPVPAVSATGRCCSNLMVARARPS